MEQLELLKILESGRTVADSLRVYVAKLLIEVDDEEIAPASDTSGILLGLSFVEGVNARIRKKVETPPSDE